jgi:hypothetical protein
VSSRPFPVSVSLPPLRLPLWLWLLGVFFFNSLPILLLLIRGHWGGAALVVAGNLYAVGLGRALLARKLVNKEKLRVADVS